MNLRRNTLLNLGGQMVPIVVSLVSVPLYLRMVGEARYGVLLIVWVLLGYFGFFDFGLARAVAQRVASLRDAAPGARARVVWTAFCLTASLSLLGAVMLTLVARYFLGHGVEMDESLRAEVLVAVPWLALALPITLTGSTFFGALEGRERFLALNVIQSIGTVLSQALPLLVAWRISPHLVWLIPAALTSRLLTGSLAFLRSRHAVPLAGPPVLDRSLVPSLFRFGGWITVSSVVGPLLTTLDRMVIGAVSGAQAVAHYSVPYGLVARLMILPGSLAGALFPRFAAQSAERNEELMQRGIVAITAVLTPFTVVGLFALDPFCALWVGREFATVAAPVGEILLLGIWANAPAVIPHARLQAEGRPRVVATILLVEILPYLALLWIGLHFWGAAGAALAWSMRVVADTLLHLRAVELALSRLRNLLFPAVIVAAAFGVVQLPHLTMTMRSISGALVLAMAVTAAWHSIPENWRVELAGHLGFARRSRFSQP